MAKTAEVSYSKETRQIQVVLPHGSKSADLSHVLRNVFGPNGIARLPRGCQTCTSGDHLLIREELADTIKVEIG
jgi:hypothetical protein